LIVLGDESGYRTGEVQQVKLAAIESEWETAPAPAPFTIFGIPNQQEERTDYAIRVPYALGIIATRSFDEPVLGLKDLIAQNELRIKDGMIAYGALQQLKQGNATDDAKATFALHKDNLAYALMLKQFTTNVTDASPDQIAQAARKTIPPVAPVFFSFRLMVGLGILFLATFVLAFWFCAQRSLLLDKRRWFLRWAVWAIPLPWLGGCRSGTSTVDHCRHPAHRVVGLEPDGHRPVSDYRRLRGVLHGALRDRDHTNVQVRAPRTFVAGYRPLPPRIAAGSTVQTTDHHGRITRHRAAQAAQAAQAV
jgi:hypothetical protein